MKDNHLFFYASFNVKDFFIFYFPECVVGERTKFFSGFFFFFLGLPERGRMLPLFFSYGKENRVLMWKNVFFFTKTDEEQCYPYSFLMGRRTEFYRGRIFFFLTKKDKEQC